MIKELKIDNLDTRIYPDRTTMGNAAADMVCDQIVQLLSEQEFVSMIFAAAPSQNEFLAALTERVEIEWNRINAFHMDEYTGLPENHPALFSLFLKRQLFDRVPFRSVNYINSNTVDVQAECDRYADLLIEYPVDIVCMGIGENGHIAFNDPHVADFIDPLKVKIVDLDMDCRLQQVNDGCFPGLNEVPAHAITLTIPALINGKYIYCIVPGKNKAMAVYRTLFDEISERCPASILRKHPRAILFLDKDSSSLVKY
jgi:glucosamine-6-phosphate deaminase